MTIFILSLIETNIVIEGKKFERDIITFCYSGSIEIVLTILIEIIIIYV